tara:strand:+ start:1294 stop:2673 length:1380 start_codon:yes stop_codon:yes gene_type:complete
MSRGKYLTDEQLGQSKGQEVRNKDLLVRIKTEYDYESIYQRGSDVWTLEMKQNLIASILAHVPVGYVHIITQQSRIDYYNVCDGKQRWTTMIEFIEDKFPVIWQGKEYFFSDLKKKENSKLYSLFMEYTWNLRLWPPLHILKQRDLFDRINSSGNLSHDESIYCYDFFTKSLLLYIRKNCFMGIEKHFTKPILNNKRMTGIRWVHNLCHLCFGDDFSGGRWACPTTSSMAKKSSRKIDDLILQLIEENKLTDDIKEDVVTKELLRNLGIEENIILLKKVSTHLGMMMSYSDGMKQKPNKNVLMDLIFFFMECIRSKHLSFAQIKENKNEFFNLCKKYEENRNELSLTDHQTSTGVLDAKMGYLTHLLDNTSVDVGKKNRHISDEQKRQAWLFNEDKKCPICRCNLDAANSNYDHVAPICKNRKTTIRVICEPCNSRKADWSESELDRYLKYVYSNKQVA